MVDDYYALLLLCQLCLVNHVIVIVSLHTALHMLSDICSADDGDYNNANGNTITGATIENGAQYGAWGLLYYQTNACLRDLKPMELCYLDLLLQSPLNVFISAIATPWCDYAFNATINDDSRLEASYVQFSCRCPNLRDLLAEPLPSPNRSLFSLALRS